MATSTLDIDQYRLQTTFDGDCVIHTYKCGTVVQEDVKMEDAGCENEETEKKEQKEEEIKEKWRHKHKIGAGGFGVVWLQEAECGKVRAVKQLPRDARNVNYSRELATMAEVKDVGFPCLLVSRANNQSLESKFIRQIHRLVREQRFHFCRYGVYRAR